MSAGPLTAAALVVWYFFGPGMSGVCSHICDILGHANLLIYI